RSAGYIFPTSEYRDAMNVTPDSSRRARAVAVTQNAVPARQYRQPAQPPFGRADATRPSRMIWKRRLANLDPLIAAAKDSALASFATAVASDRDAVRGDLRCRQLARSYWIISARAIPQS